jgi:hypothetical protein
MFFFSFLNAQESNQLFNSKNLDGWEQSHFGTQGEALVRDGQIILSHSDGCTGVTWLGEFPKIDYEISLEAKRISGADFFCSVTFPVNEQFCTLIVGGWGNMVVGLSNVDGMDALRNVTNILGVFKNDQWYIVRLRVTAEKIEAWIDDEKYVDFEHQKHTLTIRPMMEVATPFGISAWESVASIKKVQLKNFK